MIGNEMFIANIFGGILILIIGLITQASKSGWMLGGYNTMSKEELSQYDVKAICKFTGWVMLVLPSVILLLACIPIALDFFPEVACYTSWILLTVIIFGGIIYINRSPRFKRVK